MASSVSRLLVHPCRFLTPRRTPAAHPLSTSTIPSSSSSSLDLLSPSLTQQLIDHKKDPSHLLAVLSLLRSFSIPDPFITKLLLKRPLHLSSCLLPILRSKLRFLLSSGFAPPLLGRLLSSEPLLLGTSLRNRISPNLFLLRPIFPTPDALAQAVSRVPRLLLVNLQDSLLPNIHSLRSRGAPDVAILSLLLSGSRALFSPPPRLDHLARQLEEMGYDFSRGAPALFALSTLASMSPSTWHRKLALLRSLGWSEDDILEAFRRHPSCLQMSEGKIRRNVEFLVGNFRWSPASIAARPVFLKLSLEKRIIPRTSVFNVLASTGVLHGKMPEVSLFTMGEEAFLDAYVRRYQGNVPQVLDAYHGRLRLTSLEMECNVQPNIETLRRYNVPEPQIRSLIHEKSKALSVSSAHFSAIMEGLKRMCYGFSSNVFADVLDVLGMMPNIVSEGKFAFYRKLGWSDREIFVALKKQPYYVTVPDGEVKKMVHFLETELNWGPADIAGFPGLLLLSLEKTVVPRYSIFRILVSKGRIRNAVIKPSFFLMDEDRFFKKYVKKYKEKFPDVSDIYTGCSDPVE